MVGREAELGRLQLALDEALALQGGLVLVSGEPGIGKTRLVEELAVRALRRGVLLVNGPFSASEEGPITWGYPKISVGRAL